MRPQRRARTTALYYYGTRAAARRKRRCAATDHSVSSVAWLSDARLVSAGHDGRLCVWDVRGAATAPSAC